MAHVSLEALVAHVSLRGTSGNKWHMCLQEALVAHKVAHVTLEGIKWQMCLCEAFSGRQTNLDLVSV